MVIMPTVNNKQRLIQRLCSSSKRTAEGAAKDDRSILEHLLYAVCREGATRDQADEAFQTLRDTFFDWNEIRVSAEREVVDAVSGTPKGQARTQLPHAIQRGLRADWTTPSPVRLMASAGQTSAHVG